MTRLVMYGGSEGRRAGVLGGDGDVLFDVGRLLEPDSIHLNPSIGELIGRWEAVSQALASPQGIPIPLSSVDLFAPLPELRSNIICVGKNYPDHASEFAASGFDTSTESVDPDIPDRPIIFTKSSRSIIGPGEVIDSHFELTDSLDYEAELAVIIGLEGRGISASRAWDHVWGYTIINDITARDLQRSHKQWFLGKSLDDSSPMGPWAVSADEVHAADLTIRCWVNGDLRQEARTSDMIFGIPQLIETISAGTTLCCGDVIATGTPAGVGLGLDPPQFLLPGDTVSINITGLGTLSNTVQIKSNRSLRSQTATQTELQHTLSQRFQ